MTKHSTPRVLLISANTEMLNMPVLPLGLACVAAATEAAGYPVKTVNLLAKEDAAFAVKNAISEHEPDVIGISVRNIDDQDMEEPRFMLEPVKKIIDHCRRFSDAAIVLGGAGYSIFPQGVLEWLGADMGIQGEGERSFTMLLDSIRRQEAPDAVPGLYLPETGMQLRPAGIRQLDHFPMPLPERHLEFPQNLDRKDVYLPFQSRRGCPMNCLYCSTSTIEGRLMRRHIPKYAVDNLQKFVDAGFHQFFFVDNTFNLPPSYALALCEEIVRRSLNISWRCIIYPHHIDQKLAAAMAQAGCRDVSLGFESGSPKMLKSYNKSFTTDDIRHTNALLKEHGIRTMGFLLLGGPGETMQTVQQSLSFADSLKADAMKVTQGVRIYPHTGLHKLAIKEGKIKPDTNLLYPAFYMSHGMDNHVRQIIEQWIKERNEWVC